MEMEFEWDEGKRIINVGKHGVDFKDIFPVFDGRALHTTIDPRHSEFRYITTARVGTEYFTVVWTP